MIRRVREIISGLIFGALVTTTSWGIAAHIQDTKLAALQPRCAAVSYGQYLGIPIGLTCEQNTWDAWRPESRHRMNEDTVSVILAGVFLAAVLVFWVLPWTGVIS